MAKVYSVSALNTYLKNMFTQDYFLQSLMVKGEVSNCKYHSSGHIYFTLKDEKGTIPCVMFRTDAAKGLSFSLSNGQQIIAAGSVDIYERDGRYQLYVKQILFDQIGLLRERFEALKRDLEDRGMFSPQYKQPIPKYPKTLGIVTAATGAAVRDIIHVAKRRNPYIQIILYPAIVQGENAAPSIVKGIRALEALGVDVMIVGRGGGSMEDLWAFNEEMVAQAVFDCSVPIISAVGHETDTTIIDYVSDLRAPTPSAAAELAVYPFAELEKTLLQYKTTFRESLLRLLRTKREKLAQYRRLLAYVSPTKSLRDKRLYADALREKLKESIRQRTLKSRNRLALLLAGMKAASPLEKLNAGYAYVEYADAAGEKISLRSIGAVTVGDALTLYLKDGTLQAKVLDKAAFGTEKEE